MIIEILAIVIIVAARLRLGSMPKSTMDDQSAEEPDPSVERARATIGWAEGTKADWDRHVRPVLARELGELINARRGPHPLPTNEIGHRLLGPELWPLVDPNQTFSTGTDQPGPGRSGLADILDRLERL